jgi:hypothetical protein
MAVLRKNLRPKVRQSGCKWRQIHSLGCAPFQSHAEHPAQNLEFAVDARNHQPFRLSHARYAGMCSPAM